MSKLETSNPHLFTFLVYVMSKSGTANPHLLLFLVYVVPKPTIGNLRLFTFTIYVMSESGTSTPHLYTFLVYVMSKLMNNRSYNIIIVKDKQRHKLLCCPRLIEKYNKQR